MAIFQLYIFLFPSYMFFDLYMDVLLYKKVPRTKNENLRTVTSKSLQ